MMQHGENPEVEIPDEDDDEGTVVVDRSEPDEGTVVVDRSQASEPDEPEERTVVVDRSESDELEERTVVVDRSAPEEPDESTVVVDRSEPDESTVVVDRSGAADPDESTVVVDRSEPEDKTVVTGQKPSRGPVMRTLPRRGAKREVTLAPGVAGTNKKATLAAGAGAVAEYVPRAIPSPPAPAPVIELGPEASRANAPSMPSVSRQSQRRGRTAFIVMLGSVLVSITGLVLIAMAVFGG